MLCAKQRSCEPLWQAPVGNHLTPGRLPSTQVSVYGNRPAASSSLADCQLRAVQPLRKKHWHQVLFPSSQPATNRDLEMLEQWIVAMSDHLGIEVLCTGLASPWPSGMYSFV